MWQNFLCHVIIKLERKTEMIEKICLQAPPNTLFDGVTTNYMDNLTYQEFLLGILKKLNETIDLLNSHNEFIEKFEGQYDELINDFSKLKDDFEKFKDEIESYVQVELNAFKLRVDAEIDTNKKYLISYTDSKFAEIQQEIQQISVGKIKVLDPTTGLISDLQTVLINMSGINAKAITAQEYDNLSLSAEAYDGKLISAYNYDFNAREILI